MKPSFILYAEYIEQTSALFVEQKGTLFEAILNYVNDIELPDMDDVTKMAFSFIKAQIDRDTDKYEDIREKRRNAGVESGRARREKKRTSVKCVQQKNEQRTSVNFVEHNVDVDVDVKDKKKNTKKKFGEYGHVRLTDEQVKRLVDDYGQEAFENGVRKVDEYCQEKGKQYADYNLVLRRWGIGEPLNKPKEDDRWQ